MVFSSFIFLFFFLPAFLACYFMSSARWKNTVVLLWSYVFYAWGAPNIVPLFFLSCVIDYFLSRGIARYYEKLLWRRFLLVCSLALNLGALLYFKYSNFFVGELNNLIQSTGGQAIAWTAVVLPIGISFFTFHKISYIVDVYRGTVKPSRSFIDYALYIALFPQLIAGPIIRYYDIAVQITSRQHDLDSVLYGAYRFCLGLGKKVLIADSMAQVVQNIFELHPEALSSSRAWLGAVCYAYQIYFDFSGYSDMAIGLGRIMGFRFLENFNMPYIAQNFTEFWRRWHISLSNWMRDYLYIPLGGNRVSPLRTYLNLWIVFILSGFWHGASWNFVVWGIYHGFFLAMDKLFWLEKSKQLGKILNMLITFVLVLFGWVLFRSQTLAQGFVYLEHMLCFWSYGSVPIYVPRASIIHNRAIIIFIIASVAAFAPAWNGWSRLAEKAATKIGELQLVSLRFAASFVLLVFCALTLATTNFSPFIYFRF
jgi:alginate O-acetyltransferase complex protein AlgI